jgi:anti-sigma factor ChrR (cupin superfamily)
MKTCPSAETLVLYGEARLVRGVKRKVAAHLATCDFCDAEMHLLKTHPPKYEPVSGVPEAVAMPAALRRLASDLMAEPSRALTFFLELTFERERLTLTDA